MKTLRKDLRKPKNCERNYIVKKILETYRNAGIRGVAGKAKNYLSGRVYLSRFLWYERDVAFPLTKRPLNTSVSVSADLRDEVIDWIGEKIYYGHPYNDEIFENEIALQNNHLLPCVMINGKLVGFTKIGLDRMYIKNFTKMTRLREGNAFVYALYTDPAYRKLGLASVLLSRAIEILRDQGIEKLACHIRSSNLASIGLFTKCGFKQIGSNWHFKCFGINLYSKFPQSLFDSKRLVEKY